MRCIARALCASFLVLCAGSGAALAAGPVDGEFGAVYWLNDFDSTGVANLSSDAGAPGFRAELWLFNKYGLRAGRYSSDLDDFDVDTADYTSFDLLWRPISPTENNFFAVGLGWQDMDLGTIGLDGSTSGVRLSAEGRVSVAIVTFYGQASYQPTLEDADGTLAALGSFEDLEGQEYELGTSFKLAPFVNLRAGYRVQAVGFRQTGIDPFLGFGTEMDGEVESSGFLAGLTFNF